jgi:hypothetical protein
MARRQQPPETAAEARQAATPPAETATTSTAPGEQAPANGREPPRQPNVSWAVNSDRTTRIEVAAWVNTYVSQGGEEYEQVSFSVQRSYRSDDGWQRGGSWRTHDFPVLVYLLTKAHAWALERRTSDSSMPF